MNQNFEVNLFNPLIMVYIQLLQDLSQLQTSVTLSLFRCAGSRIWGLATELLSWFH